VVVGVPFVAVGITVKHLDPRLALVEALSAWFLGAACLPVVWLQLRLAFRAGRAFSRGLFLVSGLSLLAGMVLAIVYAAGSYAGTLWLDIPTMLKTHAVLNAAGFALAGILAWIVRGPGQSEKEGVER
jgi:YndJ-like protein